MCLHLPMSNEAAYSNMPLKAAQYRKTISILQVASECSMALVPMNDILVTAYCLLWHRDLFSLIRSPDRWKGLL